MENEAVVGESVAEVAVAAEPVAPAAEKPAKAKKAKPAKAKPAKAKAKAKVKAKKAKKAAAKVAKKGPGRPAVFTGNVKKHIVTLIRKHGLTGARAELKKEKVSISMPTLGKFAAEAGIELRRGRPAA